MRRITLFAATLAALGIATLGLARAEEGQGPADPNAHIKDLNLGTYWYGAELGKEDLRGKVVLVEIWGS